MKAGNNKHLELARALMDYFARRTGVVEAKGDSARRYLWTDAFAVQTLFGLYHIFEDESFKDQAVKLIDLVHETLGKFHPEDSRKGWLSGLPDQEAGKKPTVGGLRIGKKLPERRDDEPFNERLEWERDGQYFHYITRWINALLQAEQETGDGKYAFWAADLLKASGKFIDNNGTGLRMYWKMSTDLSRPLISSTGAHDPLEGLVCTESVLDVLPEKAGELGSLQQDFGNLCKGQDWSTVDPLGIGALLLNAARTAELSRTKSNILSEIRPEKLLEDALYGLKDFARFFNPQASARGRLAFREGGLSLGLRVVQVLKDSSRRYNVQSEVEILDDYLSLAELIEKSWENPDAREVSTWNEHLDINAVTLAASLVAKSYPYAFTAVKDLAG